MAQFDQQQWDFEIEAAGGSFHQSWGWGEFKHLQGWGIERFLVKHHNSTALAQVLFSTHGPVSSATLHRGPVICGDAHAVLPEMFAAIHRACRKYRTLKLNVEPPASAGPLHGDWTGRAFLPATRRFTPDRTVLVPLADDETLIRQMHAAKRRELRKAERLGIQIFDRTRILDPGEQFHRLMLETAERNRFVIHPAAYYETFLSTVGPNAMQLFATVEGAIVAGLIAVRSGEQALFMYGGSSTTGRVPGATTMLQFHAMRWAREQGCAIYDLWGIPSADPPAPNQVDGQPLRSIGNDKWGLYRYKVELGGSIVTLPPSFDIHYHLAISRVAGHLRQFTRKFHET